MKYDLPEIVMKLHDIARTFEIKHGVNEVTKELRKCADRVHEISVDLDRKEHDKDEV